MSHRTFTAVALAVVLGVAIGRLSGGALRPACDRPGSPRSTWNAQLIEVGATYGVIKLASDPPHWSDDGH